MAAFTYQPIHLAAGTPDREGLLVFWRGDLLALLVRLSSEVHDVGGGLWYLEAGFGTCANKSAPLFKSPEDAEPWLSKQISKVLQRVSGEAEQPRPLEDFRTPSRRTLH
jgi:hypothetical protein